MRSKKAIKNILTSLLQQLVGIICGFIVPRLIISNFGSDVNGLVTSITQFLGYITLLESGIGPVIKSKLYKPIADKNKNQIENILVSSEKFFRTLAKIFIIYIIILIIIYPKIVSNNFDTIFTISLLVIIAISSLAEYYFGMTYKLYLQAEQKAYVVSIFHMITTILNTISVVILVKVGAGIVIVKLLASLLYVIRPLGQNWYVKKKYGINLKQANQNYKLEQKWDGLAQHIASVIHNNTDVAILTIFSSVFEVSVYSVYNLVVSGVKKMVQALTGGIDASFGDMIAKNEEEHLNKSFSAYEFFYFTLITIVYSATAILIIPFIKLYTKGITDVNYIRPIFAVLLVGADFIHAIRLPYSSITLAAGHFKETKLGAWAEAGINILLSIILVFKLGIIGVAIGTIVAMSIRTIELLIHTSKYVLKRKVTIVLKRVIVCLGETSIIYIMLKYLISTIEIINFVQWIMYAILTFVVSSIIVIIINLVIYKDDRNNIKNILNRVTKRNNA